jgi:hypothetical protein
MTPTPIPRGEFQDAQSALMRAGMPSDPCGRCGCRRKHHFPKPTFSFSKSGGSSGKSRELPVLAPTSCDCPFCICSCVGFVEPFAGQKFERCVYEPSAEVEVVAADRDESTEPDLTQVVKPNSMLDDARPRSPRKQKPNDEQPRLFA